MPESMPLFLAGVAGACLVAALWAFSNFRTELRRVLDKQAEERRKEALAASLWRQEHPDA